MKKRPFDFYWDVKSELDRQARAVFRDMKAKVENIFGEVEFSKEVSDDGDYIRLELVRVGNISLCGIHHAFTVSDIVELVQDFIDYIKSHPDEVLNDYDPNEIDVDSEYTEFAFLVAKTCLSKGVTTEDAVNMILDLAVDVPEDIVDC